ncbi:MAG: hypothetical protein ACOC33_00485 [bacterium]
MKLYYYVDKSIDDLINLGYEPIIQSSHNFSYPYLHINTKRFVSINQIDYKEKQVLVQYMNKENKLVFEKYGFNEINRIYYHEKDAFIPKVEEKKIFHKRINLLNKIRKFVFHRKKKNFIINS